MSACERNPPEVEEKELIRVAVDTVCPSYVLTDCCSPQGFVHMFPLFCLGVGTTKQRGKSSSSTASFIYGFDLRGNSGSFLIQVLASFIKRHSSLPTRPAILFHMSSWDVTFCVLK